jgi:hypothetical protein
VAPFITAHAQSVRTAVAARTAPVAVSAGQVVAWQVKSGGIRFGEVVGQSFNLNGVSMVRVYVIDVRAIPAIATEWPSELPILPVRGDDGTQRTRTVKSKDGARQALVWETASLPSFHIVPVTLPTVTASARKSKNVDTISI